MKKRIVNQLLKAMVFLAVITAFSSCNRGVGCPTNFSIEISVADVAQTVSTALFNK